MFFSSNRLLTDTAIRLQHGNPCQNAEDGVEAQLLASQGGVAGGQGRDDVKAEDIRQLKRIGWTSSQTLDRDLLCSNSEISVRLNYSTSVEV